MHTQSKTQRATIVPLLMAGDKAVKAKNQVDDILEECGAVVVDDDNAKVVFTGLGNNSFSLVFKPLNWSPTVAINHPESIVMDDLEGLNPDHRETIRQRVLKLSVDNYDCANEALHRIIRQFCRLYKLLSMLSNENHETLSLLEAILYH